MAENGGFLMVGAIIGDIVGSVYEWDNLKSKDFFFLTPKCFFTDDSIMTIAIAVALLKSRKDPELLKTMIVPLMQQIGRPYPRSGYGGHFYEWMYHDDPKPYNSLGNGAGMRVSAVGRVASSIEEVKLLSKLVTEVTHNHPEGLRAAEAIAMCTFLAYQGKSKEDIRTYVQDHYYPLEFTLDEIRPFYTYDVTAPGSTPEAIVAFLESTDYEDAIRNAISIGGDSDTIAAMTGAIAEAYYGIPKSIKSKGLKYLTPTLYRYVVEFESKYPGKIVK
jgi:ADP-ribosylglycohydrolase